MGEGITEATLVKWLKKPGDQVAKDEPLLEVSTDKVDTEIPSPGSGFLLNTTVKEGTTVEVNSTIAWIGPEGMTPPDVNGSSASSVSDKPLTQNQKPIRPAPALQTPRNSPGAVLTGPVSMRTSPLVRKMARDIGLDPRMIPGSGLNGRVTKVDLEEFARSPSSFSSNLVAQEPELLSRVSTVSSPDGETLDGVIVRREKMSKMRRLIAEHMVESVRTSPHVTTTFEIDLHRVVAMREKHKQNFEKKHGVNLTYTPMFLKAAVDAIKLHPIVNVSVDGDEILWKDQINIGCAVALGSEGGGGLIVPVIKSCQTLSLHEIAIKLSDLAQRARAKKLSPHEVVGGTFSVTNPGGWGSIHSNPIINQPQVAMLGIGAIVRRPVVVDETIVIRPMMMASLTFDHRVIDGEGGAKWLATFKKTLEEWPETI
jgi:2-oxoglutarate dehydrogenase E2 component (dihydrolipoamide succinyltransferase)